MRGIGENQHQRNLIEVHYYNIVIYVEINRKEDEYLIEYLKKLVGDEGRVTLKTILNWCRGHNLNYRTKFQMRWDFPLHANLINLVKYYHVLWNLRREEK